MQSSIFQREAAATRRGPVGIPEVVGALGAMGFQYRDIAYAVGATERSVSNWAKGEPVRRRHEDRLMALYRATLEWGPETNPRLIGEWFRTPHRLLGGRRPLDLCEGGQYERVQKLIGAMQAGEIL